MKISTETASLNFRIFIDFGKNVSPIIKSKIIQTMKKYIRHKEAVPNGTDDRGRAGAKANQVPSL